MELENIKCIFKACTNLTYDPQLIPAESEWDTQVALSKPKLVQCAYIYVIV